MREALATFSSRLRAELTTEVRDARFVELVCYAAGLLVGGLGSLGVLHVATTPRRILTGVLASVIIALQLVLMGMLAPGAIRSRTA